jgi:hypothetical protein
VGQTPTALGNPTHPSTQKNKIQEHKLVIPRSKLPATIYPSRFALKKFEPWGGSFAKLSNIRVYKSPTAPTPNIEIISLQCHIEALRHLDIVFFKLHSSPPTPLIHSPLHSTLHSLHSLLYTVHSTLCTLLCTLSTLHSLPSALSPLYTLSTLFPSYRTLFP